MCNRRFHELIRPVAPLGALGALLLAGCGSTPRHSNVLIFGTNTRLALNVTYDPKTQEPDLLFGYKRQEAVWMPLLANVATSTGASQPPTAEQIQANNNLLYMGKDGSSKTDTYSVLASFGARFEAKAKNEGTKEADGKILTKPDASNSGGLAQFFATGLAARILAEKGGESLVSLQKTEASANARTSPEAVVAQAEAKKAQAETERAQIAADLAKHQDVVRTQGQSNRAEAEKILAGTSDGKITTLMKAASEAKLISTDEEKITDPAEQRKTLLKNFDVGSDSDANKALVEFLKKVR